MKEPICELYHENFQNYKSYGIPHAQLVIADIPYNIGADAYASNPMWYKDGDNKKAKASCRKHLFLTAMGDLKSPSICIFAQSYW